MPRWTPCNYNMDIMAKSIAKGVLLVAITLGLAALIYTTAFGPNDKHKASRPESLPIPVEVADIEQGDIERVRTFSGTLQPIAQSAVAAKVSGRVEQLVVDLADPVTQGQVVARLDNDEYLQAVRRAQADLAVAEANFAESNSLLTIAHREFNRLEKLRKRGLSTESELDAAKADQLAKQAHVDVTRAQRTRAQSELESARIQLGYTEVVASWRGEQQQRVVAERYVDEGDTVAANQPLLRVVQLHPIKVVIHATEKDYPALLPEQSASLVSDAYPGRTFSARIVRISPVFQENSRQAQVELWVDNTDEQLKPGMFVRVRVVLDRAPMVTVAPEPALTTRDGQLGVFLVSQDGASVRWHPVEVGIRQQDRVQILGEALTGRVVTLGQQLLTDGSAIRIPGDSNELRP